MIDWPEDFFKSTALSEQGDLVKARKMPVGTVSKGRKKIAEGKWVPVEKEKKAKVESVDWENLPESGRQDIADSLQNLIPHLNDWNPSTLRENLDNEIDLKLNKKSVSVNDLYKDVKSRWSVSKKAVDELKEKIKKGIKLDPIMVNGSRIFDGGHRVTAYKELGFERIPVIDIASLVNRDWEKEGY